MKKIMFDDHEGLTRAVLDGTKTMTRRVQDSTKPEYKHGEIVAVAQSYSQIKREMKSKRYDADIYDMFRILCIREHDIKSNPGWDNKMFVKSGIMPHQIRITHVGVERMQDISDEDCQREGIVNFEWTQHPKPFSNETIEHSSFSTAKCRDAILDPWTPRNFVPWFSESAKDAFASLVGRTMGKKAWLKNPWVYVYSFELIR